jgi:Family of unknown function (DUF5343)
VADKHPYMSGSGGVTQLVGQLRKAFPATVTADTLKKLGIAPQNETYVLNIMKFIGVLDAENKKTAAASPVFNKHDDSEFQQEFAKLIIGPYHELFDLHGDDAWALPLDKLISFFRNHDGTSDVVGKRQATTFQTLARISGKLSEGVAATAKAASNSGGAKTGKKVLPAKKPAAPAPAPSLALSPVTAPVQPPAQTNAGGAGGVGLTVRIEINLPPGGDQATYDVIFKSIRENLLNGNGA